MAGDLRVQLKQVDLLNPIRFRHMLPKELEATEQMSMEKLIASETLQPIGNQKRDFKANQKNKTTPQSKHL